MIRLTRRLSLTSLTQQLSQTAFTKQLRHLLSLCLCFPHPLAPSSSRHSIVNPKSPHRIMSDRRVTTLPKCFSAASAAGRSLILRGLKLRGNQDLSTRKGTWMVDDEKGHIRGCSHCWYRDEGCIVEEGSEQCAECKRLHRCCNANGRSESDSTQRS